MTNGEQYKLDEFKRIRGSEFELKELEDWMVETLGVTRIQTGKALGKKKGQGSKRFYFHRLKKEYEGDGHFTIHVLHKKKERILTINFQKKIYPILSKIIYYMTVETKGES